MFFMQFLPSCFVEKRFNGIEGAATNARHEPLPLLGHSLVGHLLCLPAVGGQNSKKMSLFFRAALQRQLQPQLATAARFAGQMQRSAQP
jgi:hypothetical protein